MGAQRCLGCGKVTACIGGSQGCEQLRTGGPVDADRFGFFPVGRNLQDRRTAEAAVCEEHLLAEGTLAEGRDDGGRDAGEVGELLVLRSGEGERNQRGAAWFDRDAELPRNVVAESRCAHLGNRQAATSKDERGGGELLVCADEREQSRRVFAPHL